MTGGGKLYFRPKEGLFAAANLTTFSDKIWNLFLQALKHTGIHCFLCSVCKSDLNNGNSKKCFVFLCHLALLSGHVVDL